MSMRFVVVDTATREIVRSVVCPPGVAALQAQAGQVVLQSDEAAAGTHYLADAGLVPYTAAQADAKAQRPSGYTTTWSNVTFTWSDERPLADLKAAKLAEITAARDAADVGTFMFAGHPIQANDKAQKRISAVAMYVLAHGTFPPDFPGYWKDADNAQVPIPDLAAWAAFTAAMTAQGTRNFAISEALKAAVASATTREAVAALSWPTT